MWDCFSAAGLGCLDRARFCCAGVLGTVWVLLCGIAASG